jgi:hypothetical protein
MYYWDNSKDLNNFIANLNSIATAAIVYAAWHINLSAISKLRGIYTNLIAFI